MSHARDGACRGRLVRPKCAPEVGQAGAGSMVSSLEAHMSLSLFDLTGRIALVTGSSQGIGLAMAAGLARAGARVVLNGRDAAKLDAAVALLRGEGLEAVGKAFDVSDSAAVEKAVAEIESETGPVSILINNAGKQHRAPAAEFPDEAGTTPSGSMSTARSSWRARWAGA